MERCGDVDAVFILLIRLPRIVYLTNIIPHSSAKNSYDTSTPQSNNRNGDVHPSIQQNGLNLLRKMCLTQTQRGGFSIGRDVMFRSMCVKVFGGSGEGGGGFAKGERGTDETATELC